MRAVFEYDLRDRVRKVAPFIGGDKVLNQRRGTIFLSDYEHARERGAVRRATDERDLQRRLELHVLRNENKNTRLHERRVQRSQTVVVITRVAREILANNLSGARVATRTEQIGRDYFSERTRLRQVIAQETIHDHELRTGRFRIRETTHVNQRLAARYRFETLLRERREVRVLPLLFPDGGKAQLLKAVHRAVAHEFEPRRRGRQLGQIAKRRLITVFCLNEFGNHYCAGTTAPFPLSGVLIQS